jgi:hypothetical protein
MAYLHSLCRTVHKRCPPLSQRLLVQETTISPRYLRNNRQQQDTTAHLCIVRFILQPIRYAAVDSHSHRPTWTIYPASQLSHVISCTGRQVSLFRICYQRSVFMHISSSDVSDISFYPSPMFTSALRNLGVSTPRRRSRCPSAFRVY